MSTTLPGNKILVCELEGFPVRSPILERRLTTGVVVAYNPVENDYELTDSESPESLQSKLADSFDNDPDGGLLWIPQSHVQKFKAFLPLFMEDAYTQELLNFDNGGVSEAFLLHSLESGLLVEMIDPECFTEVFEKAIDLFMVQEDLEVTSDEFKPEEIYWMTDCHLTSNMREDREQASASFFQMLRQEGLLK